MRTSSEMTLHYTHYTVYDHHCVFYRPALLHGRHVVDVQRAVCGPADVSEAELDLIKREATKRAWCLNNRGKGVERCVINFIKRRCCCMSLNFF